MGTVLLGVVLRVEVSLQASEVLCPLQALVMVTNAAGKQTYGAGWKQTCFPLPGTQPATPWTPQGTMPTTPSLSARTAAWKMRPKSEARSVEGHCFFFLASLSRGWSPGPPSPAAVSALGPGTGMGCT